MRDACLFGIPGRLGFLRRSEELRRRDRVLGVIGWFARGEAVTIVPEVRICGGEGLSGRKSGWMRSVIEAEGRGDRSGKGGADPDMVG